MTIQDVAAQLSRLNLDRDSRTIQRWCKSGKIQSIVDHANGDRYLILPKSVDELVAGLLKEQQRHEQHAATTHPQSSRQDRDTPRRDAATDKASHDTAGADRDSVAALRDQLSKLETENASLRADKQVRDQMVEYQRQQFEKSWEQMRSDLVEIGSLREEVKGLRSDNDRLQLDAAASSGGVGVSLQTGNRTGRLPRFPGTEEYEFLGS